MKFKISSTIPVVLFVIVAGCKSDDGDGYLCMEDPSHPVCAEDNYHECNDHYDDDSDGTADCRGLFDDRTGERTIYGDPNCCPMTGSAGGECNLDLDDDYRDDYEHNCCTEERIDSGNCQTSGYPDACIVHADQLGCTLPDRK